MSGIFDSPPGYSRPTTLTPEFVLLRPDNGIASVNATVSSSGIARRRSSSASMRGVVAASWRSVQSSDDSPGLFGIDGSVMLAVTT